MEKEVFDTETGVPMEYTCLLRKGGVYVSATHNKGSLTGEFIMKAALN